MSAAVFTIVAKNYLPFARVLMRSLQRWAPELERYVFLVDTVDGHFQPDDEPFRLVSSLDLEIPSARWFHFKYTVLELSTAIKPFAISYLMEKEKQDTVVYLDPDIKLYGSLEPIALALVSSNIVLTPHLTQPIDDEKRPSELDILRSGTYNLGFIAVRNDAETGKFLSWWKRRLYELCVVDVHNGLFVDQKWIDLAPGLFDGVRVLKDEGLNVAYWNLNGRTVDTKGDRPMVNGTLLRFFHFSGFDPLQPEAVSKHQSRFRLGDVGDAAELFREYAQELLKNGYEVCRLWPYAYGRFRNGFQIPDMGRLFHQEDPGVCDLIKDPFSDEGYEWFLSVWNSPVLDRSGRPTPITRLAYRVYSMRTDVQSAMPDPFGGDQQRFLRWMLSSGQNEHRIDERFLEPIFDAVDRPSAAPESGNGSKPSLRPQLFDDSVRRALAENGVWIDPDTAAASTESLNELISNGNASFYLTQLAKAIYLARPDVQHRFPHPTGQDGIAFLRWFLTYAAKEYHLDSVFIEPMKRQWGTVAASLNPLERVWHGLLLNGGQLWVKHRESASALSRSARRMLRRGASTSLRGAHRQRAEAPPSVHASSPASLPYGVNLIGYARAEMGVGESVRCAARAAIATEIPVSVFSVDGSGPYRQNDLSVSLLPGQRTHFASVFHVNADQTPIVVPNCGEVATDTTYRVGYWAWELEDFPSCWRNSFGYLNEIWTPSSFCQRSIAQKSSLPVVTIPHAIQPTEPSRLDRNAFGISPGKFVFLTIFDLLSVFERKNPLGLIRAFRRLVETNEDCQLVLKVNHAEQRPGQMQRIREAAAGLPVLIIDRTIDRADVNALIRACDAVVSLHRSEGFGLTLAEAMYFGKPVIATGYSGNLDFTTSRNSFLVDFKFSRVPSGCEPYEAGLRWADPDVDHAARLMRDVVEQDIQRIERAKLGRDFVHGHLSPNAVGERMKDRLDIVYQMLGSGEEIARSNERSVSNLVGRRRVVLPT